jgi:hypothetical protein
LILAGIHRNISGKSDGHELQLRTSPGLAACQMQVQVSPPPAFAFPFPRSSSQLSIAEHDLMDLRGFLASSEVGNHGLDPMGCGKT